MIKTVEMKMKTYTSIFVEMTGKCNWCIRQNFLVNTKRIFRIIIRRKNKKKIKKFETIGNYLCTFVEKRRKTSQHFINQHTQRPIKTQKRFINTKTVVKRRREREGEVCVPPVGASGVTLRTNDLWRNVLRRATHRVGSIIMMIMMMMVVMIMMSY